MSDTNTVPATATAPVAAAAKRVVTEKPDVKFDFAFRKYVYTEKKAQKDPATKKALKDEKGEPIVVETSYSVAVPLVTGATAHAIENPEGLVAFLKAYFTAGEKVTDLFTNFISTAGLVDWLEHCTEAASVTKDGKVTIDPAKFKDALFFGAPRSVNTISSVKAALNAFKLKYADYQIVLSQAGNDQAKLATLVSELGFDSVGAFGVSCADLLTNIRAKSVQLKGLEAAKAERDAKAAAEAVKAPVAPAK